MSRQSSIQNNKYQVSHKHSCFSWWWAHSRPKHVEKRNIHTKKNCVPSWLYLQDYTGMHGQQHTKYVTQFTAENHVYYQSLACSCHKDVLQSYFHLLQIFPEFNPTRRLLPSFAYVSTSLYNDGIASASRISTFFYFCILFFKYIFDNVFLCILFFS